MEAPGSDRQYHIGLGPGEVAPWVLLVGDPARAHRVARHFQSVRVERQSREFVTLTGEFQGLPVTVTGTGIGCDNIEIAVLELLALQPNATFLRVGSCGALPEHIALGDLVISTGALRLESTSLGFVEPGYPAFAHHEAVLALVSAAESLRAPYACGVTATASGFYGWQGRQDMAVRSRMPDLVARLQEQNVANFEMESSTLFTLATLAGVRAGTVCAAYTNRAREQVIDAAEKEPAESRAIAVGLRALRFLARMEERSQGNPFHLANQEAFQFDGEP